MDEKFDAYIQTLVLEVLSSSSFANLTDEQKNTAIEKIQAYFSSVVFDTLIDNLTPEQLESIKDMSLESPEMEEKLEELGSQVPFLASKIEENLGKEAEKLKNDPSVLNNQG